MSRYHFIEAQREHQPVRLFRQVLGVPTSGHYAWPQAQQQASSSESPTWEEVLAKVFGRPQHRYGTHRLQVTLRRKAYCVGCQRLRAAMRRRGLYSLQPKAFTHGLRCVPNRLLHQLKPTQATQVWGNDITYLPLANEYWAYLGAYQDMVSKRVVSWQVGPYMSEDLITNALQRDFWV